MKTKMTLTEALREIKTLDGRIEKATRETLVACSKVSDKVVVYPRSNSTKEDMEKTIKSSYQSITDLMERRSNIKNALIQANGSTEIVVNDIKMSIASAIEQKNSIHIKQNFLRNMQSQYASAMNEISKAESHIQSKFDGAVDTMLGGKESKSKDEDFSVIRTQFEKQLKLELVDPIGIEKEIKKLEDDIQKFLDEVDVALSIANATNFIEI